MATEMQGYEALKMQSWPIQCLNTGNAAQVRDLTDPPLTVNDWRHGCIPITCISALPMLPSSAASLQILA